MDAFLASFALVLLAEMGDKTQLLAMAFATRFRWQVVLAAVLVATAVNHFLAVLAGYYLTEFLPLGYVKAAAAASFVIFGLWTLHADHLAGQDKRRNRSPFWTVAIAFFLAEMGDKTQLCTVALAAEYNTVVPVWLGTTTGMLIADAVGILVGVVVHRNIPQRLVRWCAAMVFIGFGLWLLYENVPACLQTVPVLGATIAIVAALVVLIAWMNTRRAAPSPPAAPPTE